MLPDSIPGSTIFILCISMLVMLITSLSNRVLINQNQIKAWRREVNKTKREIDELQKEIKTKQTGDKKLLEKVKIKQLKMMQLQSKMSLQTMKIWPVSMICFFIFWYLLLIPTYGGKGAVAYFPGVGDIIPLPILGNVPSLLWWYALCSMLFSTVFSRLLGIRMGMGDD